MCGTLMGMASPSKPSTGRVHVTFRVTSKGFDWISDLSEELGVDRSVVLRTALAIAKRHEPELKLALKEQT
jgi:hypothetical protein